MKKIRKQLNQTSMSLIALLYVAVAALAWSCSQSDVTPLSAPSSIAEAFNTTAPPPSSPSAGVQGDERTQCDIIGISARRVLSVSPGKVTLRVLASYSGPGEPYVRIIDVESGENLGDFVLGDITLSLSPGPHRLFIFVEVSEGGRTIQCDGSVEFEIPTTPPPPTCQGEECEPPACELNFRARKARCDNAGGIYAFDAEACEDSCLFPPPCGYDFTDQECPPPPPPEFSCATYSGDLCHATGTNHQSQLSFAGIPPGHCKHLEFLHSPGQGPTDTLGLCEN